MKFFSFLLVLHLGGHTLQAEVPMLEEVESFVIQHRVLRKSINFNRYDLTAEELQRIEEFFPKLSQLFRKAFVCKFDWVLKNETYPSIAFVFQANNKKLVGWISTRSALLQNKNTLPECSIALYEVMGAWDKRLGDLDDIDHSRIPIPSFNEWFFAYQLAPEDDLAKEYNQIKNLNNTIDAPAPESLVLFGYGGNGDKWYYHKKTHEIFGCPRGDSMMFNDFFPSNGGITKAIYKGKPLKFEDYVELVAECYLNEIE